VGDNPIAGDKGHLGDRLARLRRLADVTQEGLAERSGVPVDVIRKLEQHRKHSARLPTLHKLAAGLGVEVTGLLGDPPALSKMEAESPALVAVRQAIMPSPLAATPEPDGAEPLSLVLLKAEITEGWTLYHAAEFGQLTQVLPRIIEDARFAVAVGRGEQRNGAHAALGKALQLGGHLAIRLSPRGRRTWRCRVWNGHCRRRIRQRTRYWLRWCLTRLRGRISDRTAWVTRSSSPCMPLMVSSAPGPEQLRRSGYGAVC